MSLADKRAGMIAYLKMKVEAEDWHAVQDAGSDLREIDTEIRVRGEVSQPGALSNAPEFGRLANRGR